jgi:hypothetical protein
MTCQPRFAPAAPVRELESQIRRFPRSFRRRLRKLVRGSSRLGDLLYSFPGLAFVLAAGGRAHDARGRAVKLVKDGQSLSKVAAALDLPLWMRRLPPEAFGEPFGTVPGSEGFVRRIVNEIPDKPDRMAMWLRWVLFGAEACGESFALWLARQRIYQAEDVERVPLLPLAAFAWFSLEEGGGPARGLIAKPWYGTMRFRVAVEETRCWLERVVLDYCRAGGGATNGNWFKTRKVAGYRFMPLLTPGELIEEGGKMNNCVATYAAKAAEGACLIYSIRRGGRRVATMEIQPRGGTPVIVQLWAAGNTNAGEDAWRAANGWLSKQGGYPLAGGNAFVHAALVPSRWEAIWRPFWEATPRFKPGLADPATRTRVILGQDMNALARLAKAQ